MRIFFRKEIFLLLFLTFIFFLSGCCSVTFWQESGKEVFDIQEAKIVKTADGTITLTRKGMKKRYPLPFFFYHVKRESVSETQYFHAKDAAKYSPKFHKSFFFHVEPGRKSVFTRKPSGAYNFHTYYNGKFPISPSDLEIFKKAPLAERDDPWTHLFIVTKIDFDPISGNGRIYGFKDYLISPDSKSTAKDIDHYTVTLWRIFGLPLPVAVDIVTLPVQFILMFFWAGSRC
ncbi:MAG: hypothetical protein IKA79_01020 [Lentisphaeria bacterium]|nr:hypothetical protein [Lentisphaeria bacterium]